MTEFAQTKTQNQLNLADTDSSLSQKPLLQSKQSVDNHHNKKRIGEFYYYLNRIIGTGYSSIVYEGKKNGDKQTKYAIKVIKLEAISKANYNLLQNQIKIIRQVDHPNVLKCHEVLYTKNHCYLMTEYCEGGSLQKHIESNYAIDWNTILHQVCIGCKYLSEKLIIHRDIKPANVFCKNGVWKIGDFGFARHLQNQTDILKENYTIGSPLYMPPQALVDNVYSSKTDSFALGILLYYSITKQYPWSGINKEALIQNYKNKQFPQINIKYKQLPVQMQKLLKNLCKLNHDDRSFLTNCNFDFFLKQKSNQQIKMCLWDLSDKFTQQVTFCQFVYYLMKNASQFLAENHILFILTSNHLNHLTITFDWDSKKSLKQIKEKYCLPKQLTERVSIFDKSDYKYLQKTLFQTALSLLTTGESVNIVGAQKLLQYRKLIKLVLRADSQRLCESIRRTALHTNYKGMDGNKKNIQMLLQLE